MRSTPPSLPDGRGHRRNTLLRFSLGAGEGHDEVGAVRNVRRRDTRRYAELDAFGRKENRGRHARLELQFLGGCLVGQGLYFREFT
jgi:hypothetical protein